MEVFVQNAVMEHMKIVGDPLYDKGLADIFANKGANKPTTNPPAPAAGGNDGDEPASGSADAKPPAKKPRVSQGSGASGSQPQPQSGNIQDILAAKLAALDE